jgi:UDP-sugar pyrophosphorylase
LLYQHGLIQKWHDQNKKWVIFFQDTNPLVFRAYPMLLGVSAEKDYDFNSIACPRKPG